MMSILKQLEDQALLGPAVAETYRMRVLEDLRQTIASEGDGRRSIQTVVVENPLAAWIHEVTSVPRR